MKNILFLSMLLTVTFACDQHHHVEQNELQLNDGKKWKMNEEMKPHIQNAEMLLTNFNSEDGQDVKRLAAELKIYNQELINSCTMEGEAHEQLHKWLYGHMELLDHLELTNTDEESKKYIKEVEESFQSFHNYFN